MLIANYLDVNTPMMANVMVAIHATEQQLRLQVFIQCFNQQMHCTKQLLENRAQENRVAPQDVQNSELVLHLWCGRSFCLFAAFLG